MMSAYKEFLECSNVSELVARIRDLVGSEYIVDWRYWLGSTVFVHKVYNKQFDSVKCMFVSKDGLVLEFWVDNESVKLTVKGLRGCLHEANHLY